MLIRQASFVSLALELFVPTCNSWMARPHQGCIEIEEPPGSRRVKWTLQTGSCLASLWGFGGFTVCSSEAPTWPAGWDQLALSGSQSAWLISKETVGNSWSVLKVILGHKYHHKQHFVGFVRHLQYVMPTRNNQRQKYMGKNRLLLRILAVIGRFGPHLTIVMILVTQNNFKNGPRITSPWT